LSLSRILFGVGKAGLGGSLGAREGSCVSEFGTRLKRLMEKRWKKEQSRKKVTELSREDCRERCVT
jgi:hypothetical protein